MPLIKFAIDKASAKDRTYLVGGNRVRLIDVDSDSVAEKLFNAKVSGVTLVPEISELPVVLPVAETEMSALAAVEPVAVAKAATAKK